MPEPIVSTTTERTDILDANGAPVSVSTSLSSIFDKIESGKPAEEAIKEVMTTKTKEEIENEEPEEVEEKKEPVEQKAEEKPTDKEGKAEDKTGLDKALDNAAKPTEEKKEVATDNQPENKTEEVVPESELQVLPYDRPKTAKRIAALLKIKGELEATVATTKKENETKQAKLLELETALSKTQSADPATNEEIKKQLDELAMYRRQYEVERDPGFISRYDGRMKDAEKSVQDILVSHGAKEPLLKIIEEEGGWSKFADSSRPIVTSDGQTMTASEVAAAIVDSLSYGNKRAIDAATIEQNQVARERERYLAEEKAKATEYFKNLAEQQNKQKKDHEDLISRTKSQIVDWKKKTVEGTEFLKVKPIPSNATPEQKSAIEADNKLALELNDRLEKALNGAGLDHILGLIQDSIASHHATHQLSRKDALIKAQEATIKELQAKVDGIKTASRSVPKQGSIATGSTQSNKTPARPVGLEAALQAIEAGTFQP